jgi:predicted DNA-binding transcriptional regulator AlpA
VSTAQGEYLRLPEVQALLRVSRATLWRLRRQGLLPPAIKVSNRIQLFDRKALSDYLAQRTTG